MQYTASGMRRPVQIEEFKIAIREMSNDELANIRHEIENSVSHLMKSNARLQAYIDKIEGKEHQYDNDELLSDLSIDELNNIDHEDLQLFSESLQENSLILNNYNERIEALDQENIFRTSGTTMSQPVEKIDTSKEKEIVDPKQSNAIYL